MGGSDEAKASIAWRETVFSIFYAACAQERVYGNIYEGLNKREQLVSPGHGLDKAEPQGYEAYQRERARALTDEEEACWEQAKVAGIAKSHEADHLPM